MHIKFCSKTTSEKYLPPISEIRRCFEVVESWNAVCRGQENTSMVAFNQCKVGHFCDVPHSGPVVQWPVVSR